MKKVKVIAINVASLVKKPTRGYRTSNVQHHCR